MQKLRTSILLLICLTFLTRCGNQELTPEPKGPSGKLSSIQFTEEDVNYSFQYSAELLDKITVKYGNQLTTNFKVNNRPDGKIESIILDGSNASLSYRYDYRYNNNQLTSIDMKVGNLEISFRYTYDANGRVSKVEEVSKLPFGNQQMSEVYSLTYDKNGNVAKKTIQPMFTGEPIEEILFEYDNSFNYFTPLQLPPMMLEVPFWAINTPNNLTKITSKDPSTGNKSFVQFSYKYDSKGRVIEAKQFDSETKMTEDIFTCTYVD